MKISAIITCFNLGKELHEAVNSVLEQSLPVDEIIIVDDHSTNQHTLELLDSFTDPRVQVLKKATNEHVSAARNTGISRAKNEWILILDGDDYISKDFVKKCSDHALEHDAKIITTHVQEFGKSDLLWKPIGGSVENFLAQNNSCGCGLIHREVWEKTGGYDENMKYGWEDWEFWINATARGFNVSIVEEPLYYYRKEGPSNQSQSYEKAGMIKDYIVRKHKNVYTQYLPETIVTLDNRILELEGELRRSRSKLSAIQKSRLFGSTNGLLKLFGRNYF